MHFASPRACIQYARTRILTRAHACIQYARTYACVLNTGVNGLEKKVKKSEKASKQLAKKAQGIV